MLDLYFMPQYGKVNEFTEKGEKIVYKYESDIGKVYHMFIKRKIIQTVHEENWYDIITPYGYGGPIISNCEENNKKHLVDSYFKEFKLYCKNNHIVSEFVRFHPLFDNAQDFREIYEVGNPHKTIGTNLKDNIDPYQHEFSNTCRKKIRQVLNKGVSYNIIVKPESINNFKNIYYSTMDRNDASDFYYFDDNYFESCMEYLKDNIVLVEAIYKNKTIAMGMYFIYNKTIHIHLSGTISEYLYLSPAYILRYGILIWGKDNGYELIHHGGGRTDSSDDTLYTFKRRFGSLEFDFYTGKKIWNDEIYSILVNNNMNDQTNTRSSYFPLYRLKS